MIKSRISFGLFAIPFLLAACASVGVISNPEHKRLARLDWAVPNACTQIASDYGAARGTSGGGNRSKFHSGIDLIVPKGTPVLAAHDGKVASVGTNIQGGKFVALDHGVDEVGNTILTFYLHLSQQLVRPGDRIRRGDRIALSGFTGASNGGVPHLHFGIRVTGVSDYGFHSDGWPRGTKMVSPHGYWLTEAGSEGQIPSFDKSKRYESNAAEFSGFTYPISCK